MKNVLCGLLGYDGSREVVISHNESSACLIVIIWRCNYRCRADAYDDISYWARDEPTRISKKPKNHHVVVKFFTHTESAELSIKIKGGGGNHQ